MWAEGYDEMGEQVSWTLDDDPHPWIHILLNLKTDEKGDVFAVREFEWELFKTDQKIKGKIALEYTS